MITAFLFVFWLSFQISTSLTVFCTLQNGCILSDGRRVHCMGVNLTNSEVHILEGEETRTGEIRISSDVKVSRFHNREDGIGNEYEIGSTFNGHKSRYLFSSTKGRVFDVAHLFGAYRLICFVESDQLCCCSCRLPRYGCWARARGSGDDDGRSVYEQAEQW